MEWSPDGQWLLFAHGAGWKLLRLADMSVIDSFSPPADLTESPEPTWIDNNSFLVYAETLPKKQHVVDVAWRGSVSSGSLSQVDVPTYVDSGARIEGIGNGHGAIAFASGDPNDRSCESYECPRFKIWSDASITDDLPGWPVAWSQDGSLLAIVRPNPNEAQVTSGSAQIAAAGNYANSGWLQVLSYPDLHSMYSDRNTAVDNAYMSFSASGRYLLTEGSQYQVLDLETRHLKTMQGNQWFVWFGQDELLAQEGRDLSTYDVNGTEVREWKQAGDGPLAASANGSVAVTTDHERTPKSIVLLRDGQISSYAVPSVSWADGLDLVMPDPAPDGRSIAFVTETPTYFGPLLVLQLPS